MEKVNINVDPRSAALGGVAGLACGGLVGWLAASAVARRKFAAELDELRKHYDGRLARLHATVRQLESDRDREVKLYEALADQYRAEIRLRPGNDGEPADLPGHDPDGNVSGIPAVGSESPESEGRGDEGEPEGDLPGPGDEEVSEIPGPHGADLLDGRVGPDKSKPYEITFEAFGELASEGFDSMHLTYYAGDNVLTDDRDQHIPNILMTTGPIGRNSFGNLSGDDRIMYIRNHKLEHDFEVILHDGKFSEVVAGLQDERSP